MNAFVPRFLFLSSCGALGALSLGGCFASDMDCDRNPMLRCGKWSVDAATGGNGGSGGGSATPPGCVPSEDNDQVDADCGVFVSASQAPPTADGSQANPYASLQDAINAGGNKPIYLCGEAFPAAAATITLTAGRDVFGAMDCNESWTYKPLAKSQLSGPANSPAMAISGSGTTTMADVSIEAPDATEDGASSIAMVLDGSVVTLERCALSAGEGKDGADGKVEAKSATSGSKGTDGKVCAASTVVTDEPQPLDCGGGERSLGGHGGIGLNLSGGNALDGSSIPATMPPAGEGGDGATATEKCGTGGNGSDGAAGTAPAASTATGTLTSSGVTGIDGNGGTAAKPGQGGGGGGGGKGSACADTSDAGPSGGNGGQGGCGGLGGLGGQAGGSSIALISLEASVSLSSCALTASTAGKGGKGADGQGGGLGTNGGSAATGACVGGSGGNGGQGGPGSGASGGHSLAIAHTGDAPSQNKVTATFASAPAAGGNGAPGAPAGPAGQAKEILDFPSPT